MRRLFLFLLRRKIIRTAAEARARIESGIVVDIAIVLDFDEGLVSKSDFAVVGRTPLVRVARELGPIVFVFVEGGD